MTTELSNKVWSSLPDNVDSLDQKPAVPKYHIGQEVQWRSGRKHLISEVCRSVDKEYSYIIKCVLTGFCYKALESELNPYVEPKFKYCEKVITPSGKLCIIKDSRFENSSWLYLVDDSVRWVPESDLEPYTEQNTSHETPLTHVGTF